MPTKPSVRTRTTQQTQPVKMSSSKKKKSVPADETKFMGKPLLFGPDAIMSLRINQTETAMMEIPNVQPPPSQEQSSSQGPNYGDVAELIEDARNLEMMVNFLDKHKSNDSLNDQPSGFGTNSNQINKSNRTTTGTATRAAAATATSAGPRATSSFRKKFNRNDPLPQEDFTHFRKRVLDRTLTKMNLDPKIQEAIIKLNLGESLYRPELIQKAQDENERQRQAQMEAARAAQGSSNPTTSSNGHTEEDDGKLPDISFAEEFKQYEYQKANSGKPYEVTFGGGPRQLDDDVDYEDQNMMKAFYKQNSELKKFIKLKAKEFAQQRKQMRNDRISRYLATDHGIGVPTAASQKESNKEKKKRSEQIVATKIAGIVQDFPLNFDAISHSKLDNVTEEIESKRIIKHAQKLLQDSAKLKPDEKLQKTVNEAKKLLKGEWKILSRKEHIPKDVMIPNTAATKTKKSTINKILSISDDDELSFEPIKGSPDDEYGPSSLIELMRANKRKEAYKTKAENGYKSNNKNDAGQQDRDSDDDDWVQEFRTNNSSLLDASDNSSTSVIPARGSSPILAPLLNSRLPDRAERTARKSIATSKAFVAPNDYNFKEGQDYYFDTHPPFMKMVQNLGSTATTEVSTAAPTEYKKKVDLKKESTLANIIYKPRTHQSSENSRPDPESQTPSGLLELDAKHGKRIQYLRQLDHAKAVNNKNNGPGLAHILNDKHYKLDTKIPSNPFMKTKGVQYQQDPEQYRSGKQGQLKPFFKQQLDNMKMFSSEVQDLKMPTAPRGYSPIRVMGTRTGK